MEPVIARMILRLEAATLFVRQFLSPDEEENDGEEVEENETDEVDDNEK